MKIFSGTNDVKLTQEICEILNQELAKISSFGILDEGEEIKLGKHSVWFYELDNKRHWDLLFLWNQYKFLGKKGGVETLLRKFLWKKRKRGRFFVYKQKIRERALNQIIQ